MRDEPLAGPGFDFGNGVVGVERTGLDEFAGRWQRVQTEILEHAPPPTRRVVSQVGDEDARGKVGQLPPFGSPVITAGALGQHGQRRRVRAQAMWLDLGQALANLVRAMFASMLNRRRPR